MPLNPKLSPRPSQQADAWTRALSGDDDALLEQLAESDEPHAALLELETYINGSYRATQHPFLAPSMQDIRRKVSRVLPCVERIRTGLGWDVREFDLGLLRMIRRSSALSPVLGAGVSMGAGAPSWPELVKLMLEETIKVGLETYESIPAADNPSTPPLELLPDGSVRFGADGTWRSTGRHVTKKRYTPEQDRLARELLAKIGKEGASTDVETLMHGAQVCYDLCGQDLFRLLTTLIYRRANKPSATHRAIAELALAQAVPDRGSGTYPGWDSIITYNFDALMSEALAEQKVPNAAWAMNGDALEGDPDELARQSDWHEPVYHLHGYTPRRLFLITNGRFVFSTSQYMTTYKGKRAAVFDRVYNGYLANPVHVALYVGCSFTDEFMNGLLREAFDEYPGRFHYALLKWPYNRKGKEPSDDELATASARYCEFGVRPVWFDDFEELPGLIRYLR